MSRYPFFGNPAVYVDPAVVTFVATPAVAEMGSTVPGVRLEWSLSKTATTLKLNGSVIAPSLRTTFVTGPFTTDTSWKLQMADTQRSVLGKTTLSFCNNVFWGFVDAAPTDSAGVNALENKILQISRKLTVTVGERDGLFCAAYPKRLGTAKVTVDESSDQWQPTTDTVKLTAFTTTTVSVLNASGFTEDYTVVIFNAPLTGSNVVRLL